MEFALLLPIIMLLLSGVIQFGIIFYGHITVTSAAREGARMASVGKTNGEIVYKVNSMTSSTPFLNLGTVGIDPPSVRIVGQEVTVEVPAVIDVIIPFLELTVGEGFQIQSQASMRYQEPL